MSMVVPLGKAALWDKHRKSKQKLKAKAKQKQTKHEQERGDEMEITLSKKMICKGGSS